MLDPKHYNYQPQKPELTYEKVGRHYITDI